MVDFNLDLLNSGATLTQSQANKSDNKNSCSWKNYSATNTLASEEKEKVKTDENHSDTCQQNCSKRDLNELLHTENRRSSLGDLSTETASISESTRWSKKAIELRIQLTMAH